MDQSDETNFAYFVSAKGIFMAVSLIGQLSEKYPDALQSMQCEIRDNREATIYIFNFRDLTEISGESIPLLAQVQKEIRSKPAEVRLCGLRPELRAKLLAKGVVRTSEIFDNLQTAIQVPARQLQKKSA